MYSSDNPAKDTFKPICGMDFLRIPFLCLYKYFESVFKTRLKGSFNKYFTFYTVGYPARLCGESWKYPDMSAFFGLAGQVPQRMNCELKTNPSNLVGQTRRLSAGLMHGKRR